MVLSGVDAEQLPNVDITPRDLAAKFACVNSQLRGDILAIPQTLDRRRPAQDLPDRVDNMKVHHARKVKAWLDTRTDQIEVFYLPAYSPELNPDEYLNCDLKAGVHGKPPARNRKELAKRVIGHMRKLQKLPTRVASYFKHSKIAYAAA